MNKLLKSSLFLLVIFFAFSCKKKELDSYYARPENLGDPIYQQLQARGNFKQLLKCIDKAGYKEILSTSGWWTFFAPDDDAFDIFYRQNKIGDISGVSDSLARSIVKYSLLYNAYSKEQLGNYQTSNLAENGMGAGFKRKTTYYDWVQEGTGVYRKVIATNRNNSTRRPSSLTTTVVTVPTYLNGDNNNKYIPYFTDKYFSTNGLKPEDYKAFYPSSEFSGFNVADGSVKEADIVAENGFIHIVDRVIVPLKSLDQHLATNSQYSEFKKLLDSLSYYTANPYLTSRNTVITGSSDSVFVKSYDGLLAFSPNNENYQVPGSTAFLATVGQKSSYTLIAPTNSAIADFRKKYLNKYNNGFFGKAPSSLLIDFINAHMFPTPVWPTAFNKIGNYQDEVATMNLSDAVERKVLSNGIFYGVNKTQDANSFRTLYGVPYLDNDYSMTYMAFSYPATGIKTSLVQPNVKHTILITPDAVLKAAGWRYDESAVSTQTNTPWGYRSSSTTSYSHGSVYRDNILRIMKTGVLVTPLGEMDDLSGTGLVESLNGEYVRFEKNKIQTSSTFDASAKRYLADNITPVGINAFRAERQGVNGNAYVLDGLLNFSEKNVGQHLENLSRDFPTRFGSFYNYLLNSKDAYNSITKAINNVTLSADNNYTILVPDNDAVAKAITLGLLPASNNPSTPQDKEKVKKFILYHVITSGTIAAGDGRKSDEYITNYQTETGDNTFVVVENYKGFMRVIDKKTYKLKNGSPNDDDWSIVSLDFSNNLSSRTLIHSISKPLNYNQ